MKNTLIFKQALEHSAEGIAQCNEEGLTILWNKKLEKITGIPKEEVLGKPIWDVVYMMLEEEQKIKKIYKQQKESLTQALINGDVPGKGKVLEWEYTRPDGVKLIVEGAVYSIQTAGGYSLVSITRDITKRKKVEKALQESETKYKSLYDNIPLSFQSLDAQGVIIDINPAWLRTLGYRGDEVIGQHFSEYLHPDSVDIFKEQFPIFLEQGYVKDVILKIRHKEGHFLDVLFEGVIGAPGDDTIRTYCVFQDITERLKSEEAVIRNEQRLRSIFRSAPIGIGVLANRVFLEVNEYVFQLLGYTEDELIGQNSRMIYPSQEEYEFVGKEIYQEIHESGSGMMQTKLKHKDGNVIEVILSAAALDPKDLERGITFTALDITETEKVRGELLSAAHQWKTTFNTVDDAICIMDKQMRIEQHNTAMELMFPEWKGNIVGRYCCEVIHGTSEPVDLCPIVRSRASLKHESQDFKINERYLEITVDPLLDNDGRFAGAVQTIRDQTERILAKEALENSTKIINNSPSVAFLWKNEEDWPIEHVTENVKKLLGYSDNEVLDTLFRYSNFIHKEDYQRVENEVAEAVNNKSISFTHEPYRILTKEREVKWVRDHTSLRYDQLGNITHFEGILMDISSEIEAEETLKLRAHQLELLLDSNLALNASLDLDYVLQAAAESASKLLDIGTTAIYLLRGDEVYLGATVPPLDDGPTEELRLASLTDHPHIQKTISNQQIVMIKDTHQVDLTDAERRVSEIRNLRTIVYLPITIGQKCLGTLIIGTVEAPHAFTEEDLNVARTLTAQIAASLQNAILHDQSIQHARELERQIRETVEAEERAKKLARQLIHLQEDERKRISREMHDETGQLLTAISLDIWNLTQSLEEFDSGEIEESLLSIKTLVDELDEIVGEITLDLRPPMLDDLGLVPTLRWYIDRFIGRTDIEVVLNACDAEQEVPQEIATALYRITQETLTNVIRHAKATSVLIDLTYKPSAVALSIRDNGIGFDFSGMEDLPSGSRGGMGLVGMRDRLDLLGGELLVETSAREGTLIHVEIPY